jgi:heme/copper-type cytochrome/quinol oxidase subunit 2
MFALISYTIAMILEIKTRLASKAVVGFFTSGVIFDITSTACMILGSRHIPITLHGIIGYTALAVIITDTIFMWRHRKKAKDVKLPDALHYYSVCAYSWWIIAFIAGGLLVMLVKA